MRRQYKLGAAVFARVQQGQGFGDGIGGKRSAAHDQFHRGDGHVAQIVLACVGERDQVGDGIAFRFVRKGGLMTDQAVLRDKRGKMAAMAATS